MYLSTRKFFGFLIPGFVWLFLLTYFFGEKLFKIFPKLINFSQDKIIFYIGLLILSYFIGTLNIQFSFRFLDMFGDIIDRFISRITNERLKKHFKFLSDTYHIFNLSTLPDELNKMESYLNQANINFSNQKEEYQGAYWFCKMRILENSKNLAKECLEIEGEINFYAGMFLPSLFIGIMFLPQHWLIGLISILISLYFALRFQHLRHGDVAFILQAYNSLKSR